MLKQNISEHKNILEDQQALAMLVENSTDFIAIATPDEHLLYLNESGQKLVGLNDLTEVRKKTILDFHPKEDHFLIQKEIFPALIQKGNWSGELRLKNFKTGASIPTLFSAFIVRDKKTDKPIAFKCIARDITEFKKSELSLQSKTEQLEAVANAMTNFLESGNWKKASSMLLSNALKQTESEYGFIGVVVKKEDKSQVLRILAHEGIVWDKNINRKFYENAVRTYKEVGYLEFTNFNNLFGKVITTGKPVISNEPKSDPRSGGTPLGHPELKYFLGVPILKANEVVGMIGIANKDGGYDEEELNKIQILSKTIGVLYDSYRRQEKEKVLEKEHELAQEKEKQYLMDKAKAELEREKTKELEKAYKELKQAKFQLIQAEKLSSIGQLASGIAHELNSPLAGLTGLLKLYRESSKKGSQVYQELTDMIKAAEHMEKIVSELTSFSREPNKKFQMINLNDVIESTLTFSRIQLSKHSVEIIKKYTKDLLLMKGDKGQLQQVVLNIITNARDVMPNGGKLIINTKNLANNKEVLMEFTDTGKGIEEKILNKIFEPFFTTKPRGKGLGLGLFISHGIVENHRGRISIESKLGKGTKVSIVFPKYLKRKK